MHQHILLKHLVATATGLCMALAAALRWHALRIVVVGGLTLFWLAGAPTASAADPACCAVTSIAKSGQVTAKENRGTRTFQFQVTDPALRSKLRVGAPVYADFATKQVSLDGKKTCCKILNVSTAAKQPVPRTTPAVPGSSTSRAGSAAANTALATVALTAAPTSPVLKGQPITLTATMQGQTIRAKGDGQLFTFTAQRLTPCPQGFTIATDSMQHSTRWTPPTAGQFSFKVLVTRDRASSGRESLSSNPSGRESLSSNPVVVLVEQPLQLNPLTITSNAAENLFRVTANLADPGYPATYTFTFTDSRPIQEIQGNFNETTLPYSSWVNVAKTVVTATSPTASWEVTLSPKNHLLKAELVRQRSSDCDSATGKIERSYVVPLPQ